jgi:putative membrane protein insertion efficiency factor
VNWVQQSLIFALRCYQRVVSPMLMGLFGPLGRCRFEPSCSQYAVEAIRAHGALRGAALAIWRLCRCHPWGGCGADPVPAKKFQTSNFKFQIKRGASACGGSHAAKGRG